MGFDGTTEWVDIASNGGLDFNDALTVSAWIKAPSQTDRFVLSRTTGTGTVQAWAIAVHNNLLDAIVTGPGEMAVQYIGTTNVCDNAWHHVAFTFTAGNPQGALRLYVDGTRETVSDRYRDEQVASIASIQGSLVLGALDSAGSAAFSGLLDEISVWTNAMADAQIAELFHEGNPADLSLHSAAPALAAWYRMGDAEDTGVVLLDRAGLHDGVGTNLDATDFSGDVPRHVLSVATGQPGVFSTSVRLGAVYFQTSNEVKVAFPDGGAPVTLATGQAPFTVLFDRGDLFWSNRSTGEVMKLGLDGGVVPVATGQGGPSRLAADPAHFYWTNYDGQAVMRARRDGGAPASIAGTQAGAFGLAIFGQTIAWTAYGTGEVNIMDLDGGAPVPVATGVSTPSSVALDADRVYWTAEGGSTVSARPRAAGSPVPLATGMTFPREVVVDAKYAYWVDNSGTVSKVPLGGGTTIPLATGISDPRGLSIDDQYAYWTASGAVWKVPK